MKLGNRSDIENFVKEARSQSEAVRDRLARKAALGHCYYVGKHWLNERWLGRDWATFREHAQRSRSRDPDRVAKNICDRYLEKIAAASFSNKIEAQVRCNYRDYSSGGAFAAQVNEDALNLMIGHAGVVDAARITNKRRTLSGQHLLGLQMRRRQRRGQAMEPVSDVELRAFDAGAYRLSLDPGNDAINLRDHEWVVYSEVWTATKIRRELGIELDEETLKTFGELTPTEQAAWFHSDGKAFSGYKMHSKSPAAIVHFVFAKEYSTRFDHYSVMIEQADGIMRLANEDTSNPYGGCGMPFVRLNGYIPGDGNVCLSDFDFLKSHQDVLNLVFTQYMRLARKHAGLQWIVDRQAYRNNSGDEEIRQNFTNEAFGINLYDSKGGKRANPPQVAQLPSPPTFFQDAMNSAESTIQESSFRPGGYFGDVKSHVPDASFRRALDAASDVFGQRVIMDIDAYTEYCRVLLGTTIALVKAESIGTLASLADAGFGPDEFAVLDSQDHRNPIGVVTVRESAARFQSQMAKMESLNAAMQIQALDPMDYRLAVLNDLDTPLAEKDRAAKAFAQRAVMGILQGQPYQPLPLSLTSHTILVSEMEQAMLDPKLPDQGRMLLAQAIQMQNAMIAPPPEEGGQAPSEPQPSAADAVNPADLLSASLAGQV